MNNLEMINVLGNGYSNNPNFTTKYCIYTLKSHTLFNKHVYLLCRIKTEKYSNRVQEI